MSNKAKLARIVTVALANARAAKDLMGLIGLKGGFVFATPGTVSSVTGEGFTVEETTLTASGSFRIYFNAGHTPLEIYDIKISCFTPGAPGTAEPDLDVSISGWNLTAVRPYVTGRTYVKSTGVVALPSTYAIVGFQIAGKFSNVGIYE